MHSGVLSVASSLSGEPGELCVIEMSSCWTAAEVLGMLESMRDR